MTMVILNLFVPVNLPMQRIVVVVLEESTTHQELAELSVHKMVYKLFKINALVNKAIL